VDGEVRSPSFNSLAPSSPSSDITSNHTATPKTFSRKRKMCPSYAVLSLVNDRLQDLGKEDMFEITGKNVASKLRILTKEQRIMAKKLINDVLYEAQLGSLTRNSRLIVDEPHGYTSPTVHSHYGTEPVTVGSEQHSQCTAEPVDQESAQHTYFSACTFLFLFSDSVVCDTDLYYFHIIYLFLDCANFNKTVLQIAHNNRLFIMFLTLIFLQHFVNSMAGLWYNFFQCLWRHYSGKLEVLVTSPCRQKILKWL